MKDLSSSISKRKDFVKGVESFLDTFFPKKTFKRTDLKVYTKKRFSIYECNLNVGYTTLSLWIKHATESEKFQEFLGLEIRSSNGKLISLQSLDNTTDLLSKTDFIACLKPLLE